MQQNAESENTDQKISEYGHFSRNVKHIIKCPQFPFPISETRVKDKF